MRRLIEHIKSTFEDDFYRNITKLFTGTTIARLFPFLFAFGLARIYSPANFGEFVLWLTIGSILATISTGRYESAIIIAENDQASRSIFSFTLKLIIICNLAFGLLALFLILLIPKLNLDISVALLIVLFSFLFSTIQLIRAKLTRKKDFSSIALLEIIRAISIGIGQFLFCFSTHKGLFLGTILGQIIPIVFFIRKLNIPSMREIINERILSNPLAIRYKNFPKYALPSEVLNFISSQMPILIFKPLFGIQQLGLYSFAHRYISIPVQLLGKSISDVFIERATTLKQNNSMLRNTTWQLFKNQFILGILPFSILALWGKNLFILFFGAAYANSGVIAQLISPWLFAVMLGSPLSSLLIVFERQKFSMQFNTAFIILRIASILIGYYFFKSIYITVGLYSSIGFLFFIFLSLFSLNLAGVKFGRVIIFILKTLAIVEIPLLFIKFVI